MLPFELIEEFLYNSWNASLCVSVEDFWVPLTHEIYSYFKSLLSFRLAIISVLAISFVDFDN
jgi:hypothetical protein